VIVGRIIGWLFFIIALVALGADIVASLAAREIDITSLGQQWFEINGASIGLAQAVIQRYILPELWDPIIVAVLLWPTWAVFGVIGLILIYAFRQRKWRRSGLRN
jgi:hypothetical protein